MSNNRRLCMVAGCFKPYYSRGYCAAHYQKVRTSGTLEPLPRGFAAMDDEKKRSIQSLGGKASPTKFSTNNTRASLAGKKGGQISRKGSKV